MPDDELRTISLEELAEGATGERWLLEFERLLDNALDPNRDAEAKRAIHLKISVKPNEKRNGGKMSIVVTSKLAPLSEISEQIHFGRHRETGEPMAVRFDPGQLDAFRPVEDSDVLPITSKEGATDA